MTCFASAAAPGVLYHMTFCFHSPFITRYHNCIHSTNEETEAQEVSKSHKTIDYEELLLLVTKLCLALL